MKTTINTATQEVEQSTKYIVSDNTAMFIDLLKKESQLQYEIAKAVGEFYGVKNVDELMERDFNPMLLSLRNTIFEYVKDSMNCNTGNEI